MTLDVSSTCSHHQEVEIALHSLWYHQIYRRPSRAQVERGLVQILTVNVTVHSDNHKRQIEKMWGIAKVFQR
jgi:hypothetical protein